MKTEDIKKMAQAWASVQEASKKKMDPVNHDELKGTHAQRKDKDINNDGKSDKTDEYLHNRRKAVSAAIKGKKKDQEVEVQTSEGKLPPALQAYMDKKKGKKPEDKKDDMKEEAVNELKKSTLSSYIKKASGNMAGKTAVQVAKVSSSNSKPDPDLKRGLVNRMKGIGRAADKLAKESVEEAATHKPGVASPAGEGLSPSAKKELARKTPMPDFVNEPKIDKKTFDSMRNSGKKAKARSNDNAQGDKNVINKPLDITAKASKKEDDGFKDA